MKVGKPTFILACLNRHGSSVFFASRSCAGNCAGEGGLCRNINTRLLLYNRNRRIDHVTDVRIPAWTVIPCNPLRLVEEAKVLLSCHLGTQELIFGNLYQSDRHSLVKGECYGSGTGS